MDLFRTEHENRDYIFHAMERELGLDDPSVTIGTEVPVPYKHIYILDDPTTTLEIWCFKQDICIFRKLFDKRIGYREGRIVSAADRQCDIIRVKLEKDSSQHSHDVGLPYVIVETKMGKNINTHELLAYSEKVQMIKTIFPFCRFLMLFFGEPPARAYRHGLNFDEIIYVDNLRADRVDMVLQTTRGFYGEVIGGMSRMKGS